MKALWYLYRRSTCNRIKKALHKPITYVYLLCFILYFVSVPISLRTLLEEGGFDTPRGIVAVLTALAFWMIPGNLIAYTRRKGLLFRSSDIHFLFPSPISPKQILLYTYIKALLMKLVMNLFMIVLGMVGFHVPLWRMLIYAVFSLVVQNVLEGSVMTLLYGSEKLQEKQQKLLIGASYGLVAILFLIAVSCYVQTGLGMELVSRFLTSDAVKLVPVIGWYVSVIHLLFIGPNVISLVGLACYLILLVILVTCAVRMKCTGAYYEDAVKFSDEYEELLESRKQGNTEKRLGKKQKLGKARVQWKGKGARALFYRQLLEYKKKRFFFLDASMILPALAGAVIAVLYVREGGFDEFNPFIIPAVSAYLIFILANVNGKWGKEIKSPYTYLIPDSAFHKLWNATVIQIFQSMISGLLITLPGAIVMQMHPLSALLIVIGYTVLSANKLYALAVAEIVTGNVLGNVGKQLFQIFLQTIVILIAVGGAVIGFLAGGLYLSYLLMDVFLILATAVFMVIAALNFSRMEI